MPPKLTPEAMMDPALAGELPAGPPPVEQVWQTLAPVAPLEVAGQAAAPAAPAEDGRIPVTVRLTAFHHDYLAQRAAAHGETPERHLESILRQYRSHYDRWRHGQDTAPRGPGMPAGTSRR